MLIKEALTILQGTNARIAELGWKIVVPEAQDSPQQPVNQNLLDDLVMRYTMLLYHIELNDAGTAILYTIGQNDDDLNAILTDLQTLADINNIPGAPIPRTTYVTQTVISGGGSNWGGAWTFADHSNNFPTALTEGLLYVALDDHGAPGDADYVAQGTWFIASIDGADEFDEFYYK